MTEIDLSNYPDITDYNATINKSITIKDNKTKNLEGATLKVVTDGVMLSGIKSASVTTQSSLKISGSSLSSLKIETVSSANASQISGRGASDNAVNPPTVEITGDSSVTNAVVSIENAQIVAETLTATEINLDSMNTQLTLKDKVSNISKIKTDKVCQVILEDGTGDNIPSSTDKITVTGSGELTQIDMTKQDGFNLVALTPMSNIKTLIKKGDSIDFTNLVMLGTYMTTSRMKVFRANLTEDYTETFSKLEKNFTIKIDDDEVFKNGVATNFDWASLESTTEGNEYTATISLDSAADCPFTFKIAVLPETITQIPEYVLSSIEVDYENAKTEYKDGDLLDLRKLIVWGTYSAGENLLSYIGLVTDWTSIPANGTKLSVSGTEAETQTVTVTAGACSPKSFSITVKPICTVKFVKDASDDVNGTIVQKVVQGEKAEKPDDDPTKTGYSFQYWHKEGESTAFDFDNTPITAPVTLYAQWAAKQYTVTLWNDGDVSGDTNVTVTYDTIVPSITKPSKVGYTFGGYWTEANGQGTQYIDAIGVGSKKWDIAENVTLYALFMERDKHFIYYYNTKEAANLTNPQQFREADSVELPVIEVAGYSFDGWYDSSNDFTDAHHITGWAAGDKTDNVELWAKWTALQVNYTVKYLFQNLTVNGYDESGDSVTKTGVTDTTTDVSAENNIPGFNLLPIVQKKIAGDGSTVVEVKYNRNAITYTFKANGGEFSDSSDQTTDIGLCGETVNVPTPTRTGYTFNDWNKTVPEIFDTTNDEFSAKWTLNKYNIHYDGNGSTSGSVSDTTNISYTASVTLKSNSFSRIGYNFGGWNTAADGSGTSYNAGQRVYGLSSENNATVTLYAVWNMKSYRVSFDKNNGFSTTNMSSINNVLYDATVDLPKNIYIRTGYTFQGWSKSNNTTVATYSDQQQGVSMEDLVGNSTGTSITLYAVWKANTYYIRFNNNGGAGTMSDQQCTYGKTFTLSSNTFTKSGYSFYGWNTKSNESGTAYADGASGLSNLTYTSNGIYNLYAIWQAPYTVRYNANNGTGSQMSSQTVAYDQVFTLNNNTYSRQYYSFIGWSTDPNAATPMYSNQQQVSKLTRNQYCDLYAIWQGLPYTVTFHSNYDGGGSSVQNINYGANQQLNGNTSRANYTFAGWCTSPNGVGTYYTADQSVYNLTTVGGNVDLYAIWYSSSVKTRGDICYQDGSSFVYSSYFLQGKTPIGVVFKTDGQIKIVHIGQSNGRLRWAIIGVDGSTANMGLGVEDGRTNWNTFKSSVSDWQTLGNYPAFDYCNDLNAGGTGWYLPAANEFLFEVLGSVDIVNASLAVLRTGGVSCTDIDGNYWSSTVKNENSCQAIYLKTGSTDYQYDTRNGYQNVRAIRVME